MLGISKNLKVASLRGRNDRSNLAFAKGMWESARGMDSHMPLADTHKLQFGDCFAIARNDGRVFRDALLLIVSVLSLHSVASFARSGMVNFGLEILLQFKAPKC